VIHISESAEQVLKEYFMAKESAPLRIFLLAMVLDAPKEADEVFAVNGFTILMEKTLVEQTKDVTIDYGMYGCGSGFKLTSEIPIPGAGSGASCSC